MIDLNVLKIAGAFVAGLAGIIGILGQTRTQENKLTRSGKWLFGMAIVGVLLAMSTQVWEWRKSIEDDRIAQRKNQELLVKLDREAQLAANSLHEIRRTLTRFQTISFDWSCTFDSSNNAFAPYMHDLAELAEDAALEIPLKMSDCGLRVAEGSPRSGVSRLRIDADSPAMPDEGKYALLRHYIFETVPEIRLYKTPISLQEFNLIIPEPANPRHDPRQPDLILKLNSGNVSITFPLQKREPKVPSITVTHSKMDASIQFTSGNIVSLDDLGGTQAIIYLLARRREFYELFSAASSHALTCQVNDQVVARTSDTLPTARKGSRLISVQAHDHIPLIYSFTFPPAIPAGGK